MTSSEQKPSPNLVSKIPKDTTQDIQKDDLKQYENENKVVELVPETETKTQNSMEEFYSQIYDNRQQQQTYIPFPSFPKHLKKPINKSLYKTKLCRTWKSTQKCPYGSQCQFSHGIDELRPHTTRKSPIFHSQDKGQDPNRNNNPESVCVSFLTTGTCPFGSSCLFSHSQHVKSLYLQTAENLKNSVKENHNLYPTQHLDYPKYFYPYYPPPFYPPNFVFNPGKQLPPNTHFSPEVPSSLPLPLRQMQMNTRNYPYDTRGTESKNNHRNRRYDEDFVIREHESSKSDFTNDIENRDIHYRYQGHPQIPTQMEMQVDHQDHPRFDRRSHSPGDEDASIGYYYSSSSFSPRDREEYLHCQDTLKMQLQLEERKENPYNRVSKMSQDRVHDYSHQTQPTHDKSLEYKQQYETESPIMSFPLHGHTNNLFEQQIYGSIRPNGENEMIHQNTHKIQQNPRPKFESQYQRESPHHSDYYQFEFPGQILDFDIQA